jgi:hypothetical protein
MIVFVFITLTVEKRSERLRTNDVALFGAELWIFEIEVKLRCRQQMLSGNSSYLW